MVGENGKAGQKPREGSQRHNYQGDEYNTT